MSKFSEVKGIIFVVAIAMFAACIAFVELRGGVERQRPDRIAPTAHVDATIVSEGRQQSNNEVIDSNTRVEVVAPPASPVPNERPTAPLIASDASEGSRLQLQTGAENPRGAVPNRGPYDAMSLSEARTHAVDTSVIGRPFITSPANYPKCSEAEGGLPCDHKHRIEQFTGEPRDSAWADRAESKLRSMAEQRTPGFSIRNLECRLTTCIIEVASTEGLEALELALHPEDWPVAKVKPYGVTAGDESEPGGRDIRLTLWIFQRIR